MNISILGSTGSIGTQSLQVVDDLKGIKDINVVAITGNSNISLLEMQARRYSPQMVVVADESKYTDIKTRLNDTDIEVLCGEEGLCAAATAKDTDMVLSSIVGFAGLVPTMKAIEAGKAIALANKETLVTAGSIFMEAIKKNDVPLIPVDSEHSAIFQSLQGGKKGELRKILLTASGGPFFGKSREDLQNIKKEQALKHPNWSMGAKITIDSATLMNKGLEVIEAKWLFGVELSDIEVVVHRESIIHSMVEFCDKSIIAQLSLPSMKHPIQYAFTYPDRLLSPDESVDFPTLGSMTFAKPDEETFRCLALAKKAGEMGGIMPTVLNAANEVAVAKFLKDEITFLEIPEIVEKAMSDYKNNLNPTLLDIIEVDREIRNKG